MTTDLKMNNNIIATIKSTSLDTNFHIHLNYFVSSFADIPHLND
jgi:hypothetical protein